MTPAERSTSVVSPRFPSADSTAFRSDSSMWATPALTLASVPKIVLTRAYTENLLSTPTTTYGGSHYGPACAPSTEGDGYRRCAVHHNERICGSCWSRLS